MTISVPASDIVRSCSPPAVNPMASSPKVILVSVSPVCVMSCPTKIAESPKVTAEPSVVAPDIPPKLPSSLNWSCVSDPPGSPPPAAITICPFEADVMVTLEPAAK